MSKLDLDDISVMQYDVLKEIGNIGAGNPNALMQELVEIKEIIHSFLPPCILIFIFLS